MTLERETFNIGGNVGQLALGNLPDGVSNNYLTWIPVGLRPIEEVGPIPSTIAPNEVNSYLGAIKQNLIVSIR